MEWEIRCFKIKCGKKMKLLGTYLKSLEMVVHNRAKSKISEEIPAKNIFQDENESSPRWREKCSHPVTKRQFIGNSFKEGDRVKLRLKTSTNEVWYTYYSIKEIITYETAKRYMGSYNSEDSFNEEAFTHALVLTI